MTTAPTVQVHRPGRQHEISHQYGLGAWRGGLSITLRQVHSTSPRDERGGAAGSVIAGAPMTRALIVPRGNTPHLLSSIAGARDEKTRGERTEYGSDVRDH